VQAKTFGPDFYNSSVSSLSLSLSIINQTRPGPEQQPNDPPPSSSPSPVFPAPALSPPASLLPAASLSLSTRTAELLSRSLPCSKAGPRGIRG
jgi:hypothetical protein